MAYTKSNAQTGKGTQLAIGATPTPIMEVKSIKLSGNKWDTEDTTNMNSIEKEFVNTIMDPGEYSVAGNRVSSDSGQTAVETAFASGALTAFTITLPMTSAQTTKGDSYAFNALITERDFNFDVTKAIDFSLKLKVSGPITFTIGS